MKEETEEVLIRPENYSEVDNLVAELLIKFAFLSFCVEMLCEYGNIHIDLVRQLNKELDDLHDYIDKSVTDKALKYVKKKGFKLMAFKKVQNEEE